MFSYDASMQTKKDRVRFYIQDTKENDVFFEDEEIEAILRDYPNPMSCAINLCYTLSALFAGVPDNEKVGPYSVSYQSLSEKYTKLAEALRSKQNRLLGGFGGGIYKSDLVKSRENKDLTQTAFERFMMHNYKTPLTLIGED